MGSTRPLEWTPRTTEWEGRRGDARPPEWRKTPGGGRHGVCGGGELSPDDSTRHGEGRGVELYQDDLTPNGRGGGFESWQDDSTQNEMGRGVEPSQDNSNPREYGGPRGNETLGALTASRSRRREDIHERGRGDKNPPTAQGTREQPPDGGDGAAQQGDTEEPDMAMATAAGAGGVGYPTKHSTDAASVTTENSMHPRREYDKVASKALVGDQASVGPAPAEDGHGATQHSAGLQREEGGDKNPWR